MRTKKIHHFLFFISLLLLCSLFFGFQYYLNSHLIITAHELWIAHYAYQFNHFKPYIDFIPYQSVLGYYALLPLLNFTPGMLDNLIIIKQIIAAINTLVIFIAACWLTRFFSRRAILLTLFLLLSFPPLFFHFSMIQLENISFSLSLLAILLVLEKRYDVAGLFLGVAFLITQTAVWYWAALSILLLTYGIFYSRNKRTWLQIVLFNLLFLLPTCIYVFIFSWLGGNLHKIVFNLFFEEFFIPISLYNLYLFPAVFICACIIFTFLFKIINKKHFAAKILWIFPVAALTFSIYSTYRLQHWIIPTNQYQLAHMKMVKQLVKDGSHYSAGLNFIYNKSQTQEWNDPLLKLYVNNINLKTLTPAVKSYLSANYMHYWGSIFIYAPQINAGKQKVDIKFTGKYQIIHSGVNKTDETVYLIKGTYHFIAKDSYRLKYIPENIHVPKHYLQDNWQKVVI